MRPCDKIREVLPALEADNLSTDERDALHIHLAECPGCSAALQNLQAMTSLLEDAPLTPEPSPELERHVLALVRHDQTARLAQIAPLGPEPAPDLEERVLSRAGVAGPATPQKKGWWPRVSMVLTPAFGLAAVLFGVMLITSEPLEVVGPEGRPPGHFMQQIRLTGGAEADLSLTHFKHDNYRLTLTSTDDLPPLSEGYHYELWLSGTEGHVSAGSFRYVKPAEFTIDFNVGIDPAEYNEVEITEEPDDGDSAKTGDSVCRGRFDPGKVYH